MRTVISTHSSSKVAATSSSSRSARTSIPRSRHGRAMRSIRSSSPATPARRSGKRMARTMRSTSWTTARRSSDLRTAASPIARRRSGRSIRRRIRSLGLRLPSWCRRIQRLTNGGAASGGMGREWGYRCRLLPAPTACYCPAHRCINILILTDARVHDLPFCIEHRDVRRRRRLKCPNRRAVSIPQKREGHRLALDVASDGVLALIHRDGNDEKGDAITVLLLRRFHARQQLGADRAPRGPEFQNDGLLSNPLRQWHRITGETFERHRRRRLADRNTDDFLTPGTRWEHEHQPDPRRTPHATRCHHTNPALTNYYSAMSSRTTPAPRLIHTIQTPGFGSSASAPENTPTSTSTAVMPSENTNR